MENPLMKFGCMVFGDRTMRERLPNETYLALRQTIREGRALDASIAGIVANAMKDWAIEKGVTHFTHWFQPLTGVTAEKHDSFLCPSPDGGMMMEFSGKDLVRGEPDASSFPSGGLRATFEARGYTAWDPTSYAFIKEGILCIPTAFYSYGGEALDQKTPLLRSMECINRQATRLLHLIGEKDVRRVDTTLGPEQEYFLIDAELYKRRRDLVYCGRTLFGAKPPKGQELEDHYFGAIRPRVMAFMKDLNEELWKLGILAKTEHNETAPAQHELAPIFLTANIAADHNQLTMELMKKVAERHGLACLLHEKPFAGVNGSGKHNNWSLLTDTGVNLLKYGADPASDRRFLLFLAAVVAAVDEYQDLLRVSVASLGNDLRLGADEAPPAIISIFLGDELTRVLDFIENGRPLGQGPSLTMISGVCTLPSITRDTTDRNRTSPFAFTGNKFEFRMLGASISVSEPNIVLNTIVAEQLDRFARHLEARGVSDETVRELIRRTFAEHRRILFDGNNYSGEWAAEAARRGLLNLRTTVDALPALISDKNVALFTKHSIFTEGELRSRYEILVEGYVKSMRIEATTMLELARTRILPAVSLFCGRLAESAARRLALDTGLECAYERGTVARISALTDRLYNSAAALDATLFAADGHSAEGADGTNGAVDAAGTRGDFTGARLAAGEGNTGIAVGAGSAGFAIAERYRDLVLPRMAELRAAADELETLTGRADWPFPTYGDLLFSV